MCTDASVPQCIHLCASPWPERRNRHADEHKSEQFVSVVDITNVSIFDGNRDILDSEQDEGIKIWTCYVALFEL